MACALRNETNADRGESKRDDNSCQKHCGNICDKSDHRHAMKAVNQKGSEAELNRCRNNTEFRNQYRAAKRKGGYAGDDSTHPFRQWTRKRVRDCAKIDTKLDEARRKSSITRD